VVGLIITTTSYILNSFIESSNGLGWKGPYGSSHSNPPAVGKDTFHQIRLLEAPSNLALSTAREGTKIRFIKQRLKRPKLVTRVTGIRGSEWFRLSWWFHRGSTASFWNGVEVDLLQGSGASKWCWPQQSLIVLSLPQRLRERTAWCDTTLS